MTTWILVLGKRGVMLDKRGVMLRVRLSSAEAVSKHDSERPIVNNRKHLPDSLDQTM
jgi:hypothetical protein